MNRIFIRVLVKSRWFRACWPVTNFFWYPRLRIIGFQPAIPQLCKLSISQNQIRPPDSFQWLYRFWITIYLCGWTWQSAKEGSESGWFPRTRSTIAHGSDDEPNGGRNGPNWASTESPLVSIRSQGPGGARIGGRFRVRVRAKLGRSTAWPVGYRRYAKSMDVSNKLWENLTSEVGNA